MQVLCSNKHLEYLLVRGARANEETDPPASELNSRIESALGMLELVRSTESSALEARLHLKNRKPPTFGSLLAAWR